MKSTEFEISRIGRKLSAKEAANFLFEGHALFTIKSSSSARHWTYRVNSNEEKTFFFVRIQHGEGESYVGYVDSRELWKLKKGRKGMNEQTEAFGVAAWVFNHLGRKGDKNLKGAEFWHHGLCCKCGRELTDPISIERGIGPVCLGRSKAQW